MAAIYSDIVFKRLMNSSYFPLQSMQRSVDKIRAEKGDGFLANIKWGEYQLILHPLSQWPGNTGTRWLHSVQWARDDLAGQRNYDRVSDVDPEVPETRCDLMDAIVQKCFTTTLPGQDKPGIPMVIDVKQKSPDDPGKSRHDIHFSWTYDPELNVPVQLNWTMVCPYKEPRSSRDTADEQARTPLERILLPAE